ncbi:hypothetical protein EDC05_004627 [Coemansia umbellata]|uniref:RING-type E3 ubiquitin transferase n=1 Tax=Coemansia umbellata TaxID=1424467 RepID=A0ABQ8PHR5_9FUNG|nr:hypothetical protein EDC05_004627 [Coemansia umbellata]
MDAADININSSSDSGTCSNTTTTTTIDNINTNQRVMEAENRQEGIEQTEEANSTITRRTESASHSEIAPNSELRLRRRRVSASEAGVGAEENTEAAEPPAEAQTTARREDKGKQVACESTAGSGSGSSSVKDSDTEVKLVPPQASGNEEFSCNICFDTATDPVLTICGHLFCWSCLVQWLERSATCPVCKAGCDKDKVIPVYGRGKEEKDPRLNPNLPNRPAGQRPPAPQRQHNQFFGFDPFGVPGSFHGMGVGIGMGRMGGGAQAYVGGFGILPALMGFSSFPLAPAGSNGNGSAGQQAGQQAFASRVLMMLAAMILMSILFY